MKRKLLGNIGLSLLLAASVTVLSGCGGSKEGSGSGTSGSTGGTSAGGSTVRGAGGGRDGREDYPALLLLGQHQ